MKTVELEKLSDNDLRKFVRGIHRYECIGHEVQYMKAIRSTLLELGYDSKFVNERFRDILEEEFLR